MAVKQVNPTRMELSRLKKKLSTARRGHKLLKDKRGELMRRFLDMIRENEALRKEVEEGIKAADKNFVLACAVMSPQAVSLALSAPRQEIEADVSYKNVMSVDIPVFDCKTRTADQSDIYPYGLSNTSADLDLAVNSLGGILPKLLKLAEIEKGCRLLSAEIEKTRRRVNALEHVMIPDLEDSIRFITMKLDENERSTQVRLMKVKDMMLKQAHNYK